MLGLQIYAAVAAAVLLYSLVKARLVNGCLPEPRVAAAQVAVSAGWGVLVAVMLVLFFLLGLGRRS